MYDWLQRILPDWLLQALPWLGAFSIVCFVLTPLLAWLLIVRMPADYFCAPRTTPNDTSILRLSITILRNLIGAILVLAGVAMLVLPGQGILTILIGLVAMRFPGKRTLELRLVRRSAVRKAIDAIRAKAGASPLQLPMANEP